MEENKNNSPLDADDDFDVKIEQDENVSSLRDPYDIKINDKSYDTIPNIKVPTKTSVRENPINSLSYSTRTSFDESTVSDYQFDKADKKKRKDHKKRDRIKAVKNKRVFRLVWIAMVIMVAISFASYLTLGSDDLFAIGRLEGKARITVPENVTASQLSEILATSGVINQPEFFSIYCSVTADMQYFEPGVYEVPTNLDYEALINWLQSGSPRQTVDLIFREGRTVPEIASILEEYGVCSEEEFLEAVNSDDYDNYDMISWIDNADEKYYKLEGYLFPDGYTFYLDEDIDSVIGKFLYNFQNRITSDILEQINNSGYTMDEIVIMASIIQSEAASNEDMYNVSAVIHNRLDRGVENGIPTLGMDSTVFYPYKVGGEIPDGYYSEYDTYSEAGLPEGAISNPGIEAIKAALNPNPDYIEQGMFYFCHNTTDGTAYYARTLEEHNENLVKAGLV